MGKLSDSGVANLSLFQFSSGELGSAVASIFDGMCEEFTGSGSRKHDIRLSSKKCFCIRIALNWNNHMYEFVRHHGAERVFRTRSETSDYCLETMCFVIFDGTLFNILAIYTLILCTCSLFWNNYVNLLIFSSDGIKCKLTVLLWLILTGDVYPHVKSGS